MSLWTVLAVLALVAVTFAACPNKVGKCDVFPFDDEWNREISKDPVDYRSSCWVNTQMSNHRVHLDLGYNPDYQYGIPFTISNNTVPNAVIDLSAAYPGENDPGPFRIPLDAPIEGDGYGDAHLLCINDDTCQLFEMFATQRTNNGFKPRSSAKWYLDRCKNKRPDGWTSADAAGLPIFPGLIRYDQAATGTIRHPIRFTIPSAPKAWTYPGSHYGPNANTNYPPYGTRFRLKASFDDSAYTEPASRGIVKAMKKYGIIFADQGSSMFVTGVFDTRWEATIDELQSRRPIDGSNFEAVQSPYPIVYYEWSPGTVTCNGRTSNTDPSWVPKQDVSVCKKGTKIYRAFYVASGSKVGAAALPVSIVKQLQFQQNVDRDVKTVIAGSSTQLTTGTYRFKINAKAVVDNTIASVALRISYLTPSGTWSVKLLNTLGNTYVSVGSLSSVNWNFANLVATVSSSTDWIDADGFVTVEVSSAAAGASLQLDYLVAKITWNT